MIVAGFRYLCIMCSMSWPFIFCYYANITTDRISYISDSVYDLNWYDYPSKQQKYMILIINRSNKSIFFSGLNLVRCTLETFGKVSIYVKDKCLCDSKFSQMHLTFI